MFPKWILFLKRLCFLLLLFIIGFKLIFVHKTTVPLALEPTVKPQVVTSSVLNSNVTAASAAVTELPDIFNMLDDRLKGEEELNKTEIRKMEELEEQLPNFPAKYIYMYNAYHMMNKSCAKYPNLQDIYINNIYYQVSS